MTKVRQFLKTLLSRMATVVANDKLNHFFYGAIIGTPIVMVCSTMHAIFFMIAVSIGKEIADSVFKYSPPNVMDAVFTFIPTILLLLAKWS